MNSIVRDPKASVFYIECGFANYEIASMACAGEPYESDVRGAMQRQCGRGWTSNPKIRNVDGKVRPQDGCKATW